MSVVFALCQLDKTYVNKFREMCQYSSVSSERSIKVKDMAQISGGFFQPFSNSEVYCRINMFKNVICGSKKSTMTRICLFSKHFRFLI